MLNGKMKVYRHSTGGDRATLVVLAILFLVFAVGFAAVHYANEDSNARLLGINTIGYDRNHDGILDDTVSVILVSRCCGAVSFTRNATAWDKQEYQRILEGEMNNG